MLIPRVLTALALLGTLLPALFLAPNWAWGAVSLAIFSAAAAEWSRLVGASRRWALLVLATGGVWIGCHERFPAEVLVLCPIVPCMIATLYWLTVSPWRLAGRQTAVPKPDDAGLTAQATKSPSSNRRALVAAALVACAWVASYELRLLGIGPILSTACVVWVADIAAYFGGRAFGRHKLAPSISPGKTWEGVASALLGVLILGWLTVDYSRRVPAGIQPADLSTGQTWVLNSLPVVIDQHLGLFGLLGILSALTVLSVSGDLYESLLKREAGVKDSGRSLPGHGGFFDRMDALMPVFPLGYLVVVFLSARH